MIHANELRIGNIYNRKHGKGWTQTVIDYDIIGHIFSYSTAYALDDFEAIELTPGILGACGGLPIPSAFRGHMYAIVINANIGIIYCVNGNIRLSAATANEGEEEQITEVDIPIKYLHQLQNLYRDLTGTELIYKP